MAVLSVALHGGAGVDPGVRHLSERTVAGVRVSGKLCGCRRSPRKTVDSGRDSLYKSGRTGVYRVSLCERGNRTELVRVPLPSEGWGVDSLRPGAGLEP